MSALGKLYERLLLAYDPEEWWPGRDNPFRVIAGAILTQRTTWSNALASVAALERADALNPETLLQMDDEALQALIRPSGFYRAKAAKLKALCTMLVDEHSGNVDRLLALPRDTQRARLLSVHGIGDETADAILVYAANLPSFVIDAYTRRLLSRLGWMDGNESYAVLQSKFEAALPADAELYAAYHAVIVQHGRACCRAHPRCSSCPILDLCPYPSEGGGE